ncbi:MAG: hypothetical protein M1827_000669 [Pycnora praestabilis]|nr:MAG: hypothetical protein M1827_000669 [Pycnora praestabilis]
MAARDKLIPQLCYHWHKADSKPANSSPSSMGSFIDLPLKMSHTILWDLDFQALEAIRILNHRSKAVVESLPAFRDVTAHGPGVLKALTAISLISWLPTFQVYEELCTDCCTTCDDFGPSLFLPSCSRCCYYGLLHASHRRVMKCYAAKLCFKLLDAAMRELSTFRSIPGTYSEEEKVHSRRHQLVSVSAARTLTIKLTYNGDALHMTDDIQSSDLRRGLFANTQNSNDPDRGLASIAFSYLDPQTRRVQPGVCCGGCEDEYLRWNEEGHSGAGSYGKLLNLSKRRDKAYLEEEFLRHFEECEGAKRLWELHLQGKPNPRAKRVILRGSNCDGSPYLEKWP